jgi:DNA processing protein
VIKFDDDKVYWLCFSAFPGVGPLRFKLLLEYFGTAKKAWNATSEELLKINFGGKLTDKLISFRKTFDIQNYVTLIKSKNIEVITIKDGNYPPLLSKIPDAPFLLYVRGDAGMLKSLTNTIGVVGTRRITSYGRDVTTKLTSELVNAGLTIVSGMAYGVDTVAHETAIEAGGKTVAVLGCGVDVIHPVSNTDLYWKIVKKYGCVVSEFPVGQYAEKGLFPARNRIISGLSLGVLVTEGAKNSGSLISARYAAEQGREVFAIPGPITSEMSSASTILLKQGAKLVTCADDVLEELKIKFKKQNEKLKIMDQNIKLTANENRIVGLLSKESLHFDEISRKTNIDPGKLGAILTEMEIKGYLKSSDSGIYSVKYK